MGQKVHPTGFRIGIIYDWQSKWFADHDYHKLLQEDIAIRRFLESLMRDAGVAKVDIERNANMVTVTIHTAKPGIVIGRGGQKVDELRTQLEALTEKRIRVNIQEIRMPELDAHLVARNIADQLERRVAFRRALRQTVARTMARGAEGCKAMVAGRLGGAEMSRRESTMDGQVPLHTLRADVDYGQAEAHTTFGRIGVKVWIYKGETLPEKRAAQVVEAEPEEGAAPAPEAAAAPAEHEGPAVFEVAAEPKAEAPKAEAPKAEAAAQPAAAPAAKAEEAPAPPAAPKAKAKEAPAAETPEAKTEEAPAAEAPETKTEEAPAAEAPKAKAEEAPAAEAPEAKAEEAPAEEAPAKAEEAPATEAPEAKAEEAPAAEAPEAPAATVDAPADEAAAEEPASDEEKAKED